MQKETARAYPLETGGCLLGFWADGSKKVVIEKCIGPGSKAKHSKYSFKPDSKWQEAQIADIYIKSGRKCTYLGDWHSHPRSRSALSWKDKRTLLRIAKHRPARASHPVMAVVTGNPLDIRIWKIVKSIRFLLSVSVSECEVKEYD